MSKDRLLASRRLDVALALIEQGDAPGAIDVAHAALSADPDWDEAHFALAEMYEKAGEKDNAIEALRQYLALDPRDRMGAEARLILMGAVAMRDRLPPDYVEALFDDYAPRFEISLRDRLAYRAPELLFEAIRPLLADLPRPLAALDLGCGTGLAAEVFGPHLEAIDGVDLSERMLGRARAKGVYRKLLRADITALPETLDAQYGLLIAADVLNYLGDLKPVFAALVGRMAPGALMVFSTEEGDAFPFDLGPGQRFRHHHTAVLDWLRENDLELISDNTGVLRQEKGVAVTGRIVVARAKPLPLGVASDITQLPDPDMPSGQTLH